MQDGRWIVLAGGFHVGQKCKQKFEICDGNCFGFQLRNGKILRHKIKQKLIGLGKME